MKVWAAGDSLPVKEVDLAPGGAPLLQAGLEILLTQLILL